MRSTWWPLAAGLELGPFLYTLTLVDVATGWVSCAGLRDKRAQTVLAALRRLEDGLRSSEVHGRYAATRKLAEALGVEPAISSQWAKPLSLMQPAIMIQPMNERVRRHRFTGKSIDLPADLTAQLDGRACVVCGAEDQAMRPVEAWSELSAQLFECVDVEACGLRSHGSERG